MLIKQCTTILSLRRPASFSHLCDFQVVDDHRAGKIVVNLTGRLNKCGVISPRYVCTF